MLNEQFDTKDIEALIHSGDITFAIAIMTTAFEMLHMTGQNPSTTFAIALGTLDTRAIDKLSDDDMEVLEGWVSALERNGDFLPRMDFSVIH